MNKILIVLASVSLFAAVAFSAAPPGTTLVTGGLNSDTDPDFGGYSLSTDSFYMDETEVTLAKWEEVWTWAVANGYKFETNAGDNSDGKATNHPVQGVSWYNAVKWCNARSEMEGYTPCYTVGGSVYREDSVVPDCDFEATDTYRLPTEEEWEYAARGGVSGTRFYWGDTISHTQANYFSSTNYSYDVSATRGFHPDYDSGGHPYTSPVKSFSTNAYGLYDMVGNVYEWCWDVSDTMARGLKGGSWDYHAPNQRTGCRDEYTPLNEFPNLGFRAIFTSTDVPPILSIATSQSVISVPENGTNTFNVRLSIDPVTPRTVTVSRVSGGDTDLSVLSGASLIFNSTTWSNWQTVTIGAADDADWDNGTATIRCSATDLLDRDVTATEIDDEINPAYTLPFSETFENSGDNAGTPGNLDGQHGWTVTGDGTALVQNATAQSGSQALSVSNAIASHTFVDNPSNVWITLWAKPVAGQLPGQITPDASAVFYVNTNDNLVAYSNTTAITPGATVSSGWNKFEISCDYSSRVWNLELNDSLVVSNFAFYATPAAFQALEIVVQSPSAAYIDEISISDTQEDTDGDGLPNWWENTYFGSDTAADPNATASNGVNTVYETYIAGLDPTDPAALFEISGLQGNVLQWSGVSGHVYTVYWTSNLLSGFQTLETNVPWTAPPFTDSTHSAAQKGFYKIEVELE